MVDPMTPEEKLLLAIFGSSEPTDLDPDQIDRLYEGTQQMLSVLTPVEEQLLRMKYGISKDSAAPLPRVFSDEEIGEYLDRPPERIEVMTGLALRKLRHPLRSENLKAAVGITSEDLEIDSAFVEEFSPVIGRVQELSPELIQHLKNHHDDLDQLPWEVFEHLVAEFFASWDFEDVRLVGRNPRTSADIYAVRTLGGLNKKIRMFVEVKRELSTIGVDVIDKVYGAMIQEKPTVGWDAAVIVSVVGFKQLRKYEPKELSAKGIELRGRDDLLRWLEDYEPNENGLWLPAPQKELPEVDEEVPASESGND